MELKAWGILVATANPSFHTTPLIDSGSSTLGRCWGKLDPAIQAQYGEALVFLTGGSSGLRHS